MVEHRDLDWAGCANARDLGGIPVAGGGTIRAGALIDLRNDDERGPDAAPRPAGLTTLQLPHDGLEEDAAFWTRWGDERHVPPLHYARSFPRLAPYYAAYGLQDDGAVITAALRARLVRGGRAGVERRGGVWRQ